MSTQKLLKFPTTHRQSSVWIVAAALLLAAIGSLLGASSASSSVAGATGAVGVMIGPDYEAVARQAAEIRYAGVPTAQQVRELLPAVRLAAGAVCAKRHEGVSVDQIADRVAGEKISPQQAIEYVGAVIQFVCDRQK